MVTQLICQQCEELIETMQDEKAGILYGKCLNCSHEKKDSK